MEVFSFYEIKSNNNLLNNNNNTLNNNLINNNLSLDYQEEDISA